MALGSSGNDTILSVDAVTKPAEDGLDRVAKKMRQVTEETKKAEKASKDYQQTLSKQIQAGGRMTGTGGAASSIAGGMQMGGGMGMLLAGAAGVGAALTVFERFASVQEQNIIKTIEWEKKLADARRGAIATAAGATASALTSQAGGYRSTLAAGGPSAVALADQLARGGNVDQSAAFSAASALGSQAGNPAAAAIIELAAKIGAESLPKIAEAIAKNPGILTMSPAQGLAAASSIAGAPMTVGDVLRRESNVAGDPTLSRAASLAGAAAKSAQESRSNSEMARVARNLAEEKRLQALSPAAMAENKLWRESVTAQEEMRRMADSEGLLGGFLAEFRGDGSYRTRMYRDMRQKADATFRAVVPAPAAEAPSSP